MLVNPAVIAPGRGNQQTATQSSCAISLGELSSFLRHYLTCGDEQPWPPRLEHRGSYQRCVVLDALEHYLAHSLTWLVQHLVGPNPVLDSDLPRSACYREAGRSDRS